MENAFLTIKNLSAHAGSFRLDNIFLNLYENEYLVLLGPTGCGKTTLLNIIAGIHPHETGTIEVDNLFISELPPEKRNIGYITQRGDLFPHLSVRQNITFGLKYQKLSKIEIAQREEEIYHLLKMDYLLDQMADTLSGGEIRRVALARGLILKPKILLLDEPLSMFDHNTRQCMMSMLRKVHKELKTTAIHVTHDREEAIALGDSCAIMKKGTIIEYGNCAKMFETPDNTWSKHFLGCMEE